MGGGRAKAPIPWPNIYFFIILFKRQKSFEPAKKINGITLVIFAESRDKVVVEVSVKWQQIYKQIYIYY